jgi:glycosyltransferase involved in cell wall biosynthesis
VLSVSRLAVRKGVELVTELSHRLDDLAGEVRIDVIGNHSLWSDCRALMRDLNPAVATYKGEFANGQLAEAYAGADLLIQPSHYEPFALTVGEALACGVPVVASSEVGATEGVDPACCTVFPAGDIDPFEAAVHGAVDRVRGGGREPIAAVARAEAQRLFSADRVADGVLEALTTAARDASPPGTTPGQSPRRSPLRERGRRTLARYLASVAKRPLRPSEPHSQPSGAAPSEGRLRVALLAHDVHNEGGMERACLELLERASDRVDFVVISGHVDPRVRTQVDWRRLPLPARPFPLKFTIFYLLAGLRLLTESVDLVHSVGAVVPNKVDIATVHFCHAGFRAMGPEFALPNSLLRRTNARISRGLALITEKWSYRADRVRLLAPVSTGVEEEVRRLYPGIDAAVTPNGVDHHRFRPEPEVYRRTRLDLGVDADECVAVFVGGDWDRKGVGVAIAGLAEGVARGVRLSLWVVGPGDRARFEAQATELGVAEHVRFFGRRSDTERFYQAADVCVIPTLYETFCLAAFEAAACALPVVATPVHGVADLIGDDIAGIRVERTPHAVGAALARLAADRGLRTALGARAHQRAARYTWSRSVDSVLACYARLAGPSRLQAHRAPPKVGPTR